MIITSSHKRSLRQKAHKLKPVVIIGNSGVTEAVQKEIGVALDAHELIKIRINANTREDRQAMIETILEKQGATLIQTIGHILTLYRPLDS